MDGAAVRHQSDLGRVAPDRPEQRVTGAARRVSRGKMGFILPVTENRRRRGSRAVMSLSYVLKGLLRLLRADF